ncbi:lantibiotic dehydratase family protein [Flavobacterium sp. LM4]|uniref:lantibiotic dehydratase family protein n=1 Tax=Flavobacterium sp. LM4 TaxID=1938609 RepID=UPI000993B82B|nr:lantibiotic dehydratase family protein [Flavobacterium sp. LM4]OOV17356.1 hypothetical protein BXU10_14730 [Flavobacterium sp. LM4]
MYKIFDTYVLRTPLLTIDFFFKLTKENKVTDEQLKHIFLDSTIKEAIFLASPVFYKEVEKWSTGQNLDEKGEIRNSFLKYLSRICSRPTPFGLFSGCSTGHFLNESRIERENSLNKRHTRLDMDLTGLLIKYLKEIPSIKEQLNFFPNNSLFELGNFLRFIESKYNDNVTLVQKMIEVESSDYLKKIIQFCGEGKSISQISNLLVSNDIEFDDAREFIIELIDSQILVSELEQTVSGMENFDHIVSVLKRIDNKSSLIENLTLIKLKLAELDNDDPNSVDAYLEIIELLKEFNIAFNEKYVFQTDLIIGHNHNTLNGDLVNNIYEGLTLINKISSTKNNNTNLSDFKKAFYERYETKEISLALALDNEIGLGYPINSGKGDPNPFIDDIMFNNSDSKETSAKLSQIDVLLFNKIIEAEKSDSKVIEIREDEIKILESNWLNLPDTFSTIAQIAVIENQTMIHLSAFSGSSAGNLFGRFCHGDLNLNKFVEEIVAIENNLNPNTILAEIVHLPEDRIGNVLMRPSLRNYEIPFLSRSTKSYEEQIPISDLLISIKNNRIFLRSKKLNKEICPRLTTAHNYKLSNLSIYRFLCDMQSVDKRKSLTFEWNAMISSSLTFFPRVIYKNIILSTSKWKITSDKIKRILDIKDDLKLFEKFVEFSNKYNIPKLVYLVEGDNKLLINIDNLSSIKMLLSLIKNKSFFFLEEFLFSDDTICTDPKGKGFVNEFVFSFYKN